MRGVMSALLVLLLSLTAVAPAAAAVEVRHSLEALARDIGAARAHAVALRERFAVEVSTGKGADIAGIDDGGVGSSLTALRLVARALDRRLERLRLATASDVSPDRAEVMLVLRASLGDLRWTIESVPSGPDPDAATRAERERQLERLDATLAELDLAASAMASFDWAE